MNHFLSAVTTTDLHAIRPDAQAAAPALFTSSGIQQALHPLRRTADRVTRQMEAFAEKLDRFKQQEHRPGDMGSFQAAYSLVKGYQRFGQDAMQEISRQSTLRRAKMGWNPGREPGADSQSAAKTEEELKRLQLEVDTWEILLNLIAIDDPSSRAHARQSQESAFQNLHRYSSDREIWEQFLDADQYAMECVIVMKWLEQTARSSSQEIDSLISELEAQAERGQGLWAHGWLYTKETIKGQKRLRSWPQPLEPDDPGITLSLLSSEKQEPLITQLDPDAVTRQKQGLQKQDQFYERATWLTCWKMLRQGESWTKIRGWSQERLESWRAVSLCGSSVDERSSVGKTPVDDGMTRMMNCRSQETWRTACSALARDPNTEDFERAVYALLCGETEPAYKVCQSWDDYLYVFYNHTLLSRYRQFCTQFSRKLSHSPIANTPFVPEPPCYSAVHGFLQSVKSNERVGVEARNPYRTIQAAILSKNYDSFFLSIANAASQINKTSGKSHLIPDVGPSPAEDSALIAAGDQDALRIIAHLYIITRTVGYTRSDSHFSETAGVNLIAYIEMLHQAGLLDTIPLYASLLPTLLSQNALAQVLIDVTDPGERKRQAKLMEKHGIDLKAVLQRQWLWVHADAMKKMTPDSTVRLSRTVRDVRKNPRILPVRKRFVGASVSPEDERLIRCLEWHRYLDGEWELICELGTFLYKKFFGMSFNPSIRS
jgi:nuclear pore complex protein Nup107